ncbi:MAG: DUF1211 domain-containing protein [Chloroflexi bacterium]|nr:DUF1211 domain-containing protein [Chloroflexota bacterium]MBV9597797.1 DUF1211 domain-containing protein [Chloroflexota bacterium]
MTKHWSTDRTEAFSDGVFAIAITLLVLDLHVPDDELTNLWAGIAAQWPSYLAFVTSFATIAGIWLVHHRLFAHMDFINSTVIRINLLLLLDVTFLPFPTRLMAQALNNEDAERAAVLFYGATLLASSLALAAVWRAVAGDHSLVASGGQDEGGELKVIGRAIVPGIGLYVLATGVALVDPAVGVWAYFFIALLLIVRVHNADGPAASS